MGVELVVRSIKVFDLFALNATGACGYAEEICFLALSYITWPLGEPNYDTAIKLCNKTEKIRCHNLTSANVYQWAEDRLVL